MKITIEVGPNRVTRTFSRMRHAMKQAKNGFKAGWKEFNGTPANPIRAATKVAA